MSIAAAGGGEDGNGGGDPKGKTQMWHLIWRNWARLK
jgi:hypothetical protein